MLITGKLLVAKSSKQYETSGFVTTLQSQGHSHDFFAVFFPAVLVPTILSEKAEKKKGYAKLTDFYANHERV